MKNRRLHCLCVPILLVAGFIHALPLAATEIQRLDIETSPDGAGEMTCIVDSDAGVDKARLEVIGPDGTELVKKEAAAEFTVNWAQPSTRKLEIEFAVRQPWLWTDEMPMLYTLRLELLGATGGSLGRQERRFAFRRLEVRPDDGFYLNGQKLRLRGINVPCDVWPQNAAVRADACRTVVRDARWLNANTIWCTNAVPAELLDVCDEQGLYVVGDVPPAEVDRHPCVISWNSSDGVRLLPNPSYGHIRSLVRQPQIVLAAPLLPQQGEGGLAAGLEDCWAAICSVPRCAGGIVQAQAGWTASGLGPQGTAVREIWSPVSCSYTGGTLTFVNRQSFTVLDTCRFAWQAIAFSERGEKVLAEDTAACPTARPFGSAQARLPTLPFGTQALRVTVYDRRDESLCTWSFRLRQSAAVKWPSSGCTPPPGLEEVYFLAVSRTNRIRNARNRVVQAPEFHSVAPPESSLKVTWGRMADGTYRLDYKLDCRANVELLGFAFPPLGEIVSERWQGRGACRQWGNRLQGQQYGLWRRLDSQRGFQADVDWYEIKTGRGLYRFSIVKGPDIFAACAPNDPALAHTCAFPAFGPGVFTRIPGIGGEELGSNDTGPSGCSRWLDFARHRAVEGTLLVTWKPAQ